jgi:hypothetical protein
MAQADPEAIREIDGITPEKAEAIYHSSRAYVEEKRRREDEEKERETGTATGTETTPVETSNTDSGLVADSVEGNEQPGG